MERYIISNADFSVDTEGTNYKVLFKGKPIAQIKAVDTVYAYEYGAIVESFVGYKRINDKGYYHKDIKVFDKNGELKYEFKSEIGKKCFDYDVNGNTLEIFEKFSNEVKFLPINEQEITM